LRDRDSKEEQREENRGDRESDGNRGKGGEGEGGSRRKVGPENEQRTGEPWVPRPKRPA